MIRSKIQLLVEFLMIHLECEYPKEFDEVLQLVFVYFVLQLVEHILSSLTICHSTLRERMRERNEFKVNHLRIIDSKKIPFLYKLDYQNQSPDYPHQNHNSS